jgi:hypothetical protein
LILKKCHLKATSKTKYVVDLWSDVNNLFHCNCCCTRYMQNLSTWISISMLSLYFGVMISVVMGNFELCLKLFCSQTMWGSSPRHWWRLRWHEFRKLPQIFYKTQFLWMLIIELICHHFHIPWVIVMFGSWESRYSRYLSLLLCLWHNIILWIILLDFFRMILFFL